MGDLGLQGSEPIHKIQDHLGDRDGAIPNRLAPAGDHLDVT